MAIRDQGRGDKDGINPDNQPLSTDTNPELGVTTSQFVYIQDQDLNKDELPDPLFAAVKDGRKNDVKTLTGDRPDVTRPEPSGTDRLMTETDRNLEVREKAEHELRRATEVIGNILNGTGDVKTTTEDGKSMAEDPLGVLKANGVNTDALPKGHFAKTLGEALAHGDYQAALQLMLQELNEAGLREEAEDRQEYADYAQAVADRWTGKSDDPYRRDAYGGYLNDDDGYYYDRFGGHYADGGYAYADHSFTNTSGEHYEASTGEFTDKNGKPMEVPGSIRSLAKDDPDAGGDFLNFAAMERERREKGESLATDPNASGNSTTGDKSTTGDPANANSKPGANANTNQPSTQDMDRAVGIFAAYDKNEDRKKKHHCKKDKEYIPPAERAARRFFQQFGPQAMNVLNDREQLEAWRKAQGDLSHDVGHTDNSQPAPNQNADGNKTPAPKPKFQAMSATDAAKKLKAQPVIHHAQTKPAVVNAQTPGAEVQKDANVAPGNADGSASGSPALPAASSSTDKVNTATSSTWYADEKGGFFDEFGGYYDKEGAYWDIDGTYYSPDNSFSVDPKGLTHYADGSIADKSGHTIDKNGIYIDFDGSRIAPPPGVDFRAQMVEAANNGKKWEPPPRVKPLNVEDMQLPDGFLDCIPYTYHSWPQSSVTSTQSSVDIPLAPVTNSTNTTTAGSNLVVTTRIQTDKTQDANFNVETSRFRQVETDDCCEEHAHEHAPLASSKFSFSSSLNSLHSWLMGDDSATLKDPKSSTALSSTFASNPTPPLANAGTGTVTTADNKVTNPSPKLG